MLSGGVLPDETTHGHCDSSGQRWCTTPPVAGIVSNDAAGSVDDCSASEYSLFGTPLENSGDVQMGGGLSDASAPALTAGSPGGASFPFAAGHAPEERRRRVDALFEGVEEDAAWHALGFPTPVEMWGAAVDGVTTTKACDGGCAARDGFGGACLSPTLSYHASPPGDISPTLSYHASLPGDISPTLSYPASLPGDCPSVSALPPVQAFAPTPSLGEIRCLRGINIQRPWARKILNGVKSIEARRYPLRSYLNEDLWVIETPGSRGRDDTFESRIIGIVRFGADFRYETLAQWHADEAAHCIGRGSPFDWSGPAPDSGPVGKAKNMYGWRVASVTTLVESQPPPEVKGMIGCKAVSRRVGAMREPNHVAVGVAG